MPSVRVSFDRGTLRIDGDPGPLRDLVRFDPRTGFHRASAHCYGSLLRAAQDCGLVVDDQLAPSWTACRRPTGGPPLRPYQEQALAAFETFGQHGIIALPTGSGKTRVACAAMARTGDSAVVLVPTRALLDQWLAILRAQFGDPIGLVGDGRRSVARITVMTFESAYRCLDRFGDAFGMIVVDEAHHFAGGVRAEALEMCAAPVRLGLTATPPTLGSRGAERLRDLIGPVVFELEIADLAGNHLAPLEVVRIYVSLTAEERERYEADMASFVALRRDLLRANPEADWLTCVRTIARMPEGSKVLSAMQRGSALAAFPRAKRVAVRGLLARHRVDRTLVFTARADDAYAIAQEALIPVITANVARTERDAILASFRDRRVRAICSARVLNEGIDVPEANVAIIVAGALGVREHVQRVGRVLRPGEGKRAIAYELVTIDTMDEARTRARGRGLAAARSAARPAI